MKKMAICFRLRTIILRAISILVASSAMVIACNWSPIASFCLASGAGRVSQEQMTTETHQHPHNSRSADENPIGHKRVKKATLCQNGTILHLKTKPDDSTTTLSRRELKKKSVIRSKKKSDAEKDQIIEDENQEDGKGMIEVFYTLFEKKKEPIEEDLPQSGEDTICGLSNNGIPYVILKNGNRIFKGGKLNSGCVVETIGDEYVILNCNGLKKKQTF
jgi:hypothetical protein